VSNLDPQVERLLQGPNYAHLATVLPDGSPHSVPVWSGIEDGRVVFFTQPASRKARNVERDARVAISIVDHDDPYRMGWLRGRVVGTRKDEAALEVMDRMSVKFTGEPFPVRHGVLFEIEPERSGSMNLPLNHSPAD
jgi:PPOX class probable F420-dependent enzyme